MNNAVHYEDALMVKAAWYYYFEKYDPTGHPSPTGFPSAAMRVIKLLDAARQSGVIQFRLRSDSVGMMQQSRELMQKYHLNDVFIIGGRAGEGQLSRSIARAGAMYVADRLSEKRLHQRRLRRHAQPNAEPSGNDGAKPRHLHLADGRRLLLFAQRPEQHLQRAALSHARAAAASPRDGGGDARGGLPSAKSSAWRRSPAFTLVGIGAMHETATIVRSGIITPNELFRLKMSGAVGDVLCHFVDENGELIPSDIEDRLISTPLEKLRAMDNVVGLAAGAQRWKPSAPCCAAATSTCSSPMSRPQLCFSRASDRP